MLRTIKRIPLRIFRRRPLTEAAQFAARAPRDYGKKRKAQARSAQLFMLIMVVLGADMPPLWAQDAEGKSETWGRFEFAAGAFDISDKGDDAAIFQLTYLAPWRFGGGAGWFRGFAPYAALAVNTDGGVFGHGGLYADFRLGRHWQFLPAIGGGGYSQGQSKDLGGVFQFALGFAALYRVEQSSLLPAGSAVGIRFLHISNGGAHERNPGANSVFALFSVPF